ncbi:hypothetical protein EVJ22_09335 [Exiguobacterium sp. SH0S7]|uniref:hypothetical protein n=1 Tax=Exiguobacterium sp. SH0S7 TaxID=2510951 RepID=UPI00103B06B6|nr:hypothetical protein [Exiguobacterium sp. SH0S7]TCI70515.1 hypothetical protein EVJ22_09335 [Exiguobacterium sp. SH0S7]
MKHLFGFLLFLVTLAGGVAITAGTFGEEPVADAYEDVYEDDIPLATSIDAELEDVPETFKLISEVFDEPISAKDVKRIYLLVSNPDLDEATVHPLGELEVTYDGQPTTLIVEAEVDREDGTYIVFYFSGDEEMVFAIDDRITAYYEELGI